MGCPAPGLAPCQTPITTNLKFGDEEAPKTRRHGQVPNPSTTECLAPCLARPSTMKKAANGGAGARLGARHGMVVHRRHSQKPTLRPRSVAEPASRSVAHPAPRSGAEPPRLTEHRADALLELAAEAVAEREAE